MITAGKRTILSATLATALGIALVGCAGGGSTASSDFTFWGLNAAVPPVTTLEQLQSDVCTDEVAQAPLVTDNSTEDQYDQKVQLAAGQDALPGAFVTPSSNELTKQLIDSGRLVNISEVLDEEGLTDEILPAAASTIRAIYGTDDLYALPHELNIEGIWYNKAIFEEQGIEIPGTWDEKLVALAPSTGPINTIMQWLGSPGVDFLGNPTGAFWVVILMDIWRGMGFFGVILYAGLLDIPDDILEAARIDGAGGWRLVQSIVLPLSLPVLLSSIIFSISGNLKVFDSVVALTAGGPGNTTTPLTLYMFDTSFTYGEFGYGSTIAVMLAALCLVFTVLIFRATRRDLTET